ncbi:UDP-N-acetylmuramate--alanine ligase [Candidatus Methylacidiphilum fumarolicum]|uniref:Multifunctional fusion protein n=2 Tax=Candidatus Methylacidiphilum fumarolicum TaxID=591154 RepID=I0JW42_METFB|nr:UDP-N-acetylmuramate--L-alanine ligase [Candidatus Methylacidiphilum fumarolicum]MBW6415710.1 UDP-N-acetylmuramate--L-alanine ligase [Candidatus Methylacidiphilum fumarolicum]TFE68748.1 UDP-N-acetylmuramate--alanine ligase [Candidatus Methylacidiphilum fumarolicum]TFE71911.1 UDP-N-acetylmuramate--alanine ligase [Candidatus Methylacidiphilum fumarolicum]TFE72466.1 UDP-N-acetylmuramate--alanine ligase [Candidatus Methylacidiphilum fumarolicum]TFE76628.1 UDP-N-acetylmuramate--alanine ligase [C
MSAKERELVQNILKNNRSKIHLLGVCGSGMAPLALLLLARGYKVSGSDHEPTEKAQKLIAHGLEFYPTHDQSQVLAADLVCYSSAIPLANPELEACRKFGIPLVKRAFLLSLLAAEKKVILVSGMHGKSTTSAMIAWILQECGLNPSFYLGAETISLRESARWSPGEYMVIEGDESDGSFLYFSPHALVVLNIEEEHLNYYADIHSIVLTFREMVAKTTDTVVYNQDDPHCQLIAEWRKQGAINYSLRERAAAFWMKASTSTSGHHFYKGEEWLCEISLAIPGIQNVQNALAALSLTTTLGVSPLRAACALGNFQGIRRRFELKFKGNYFELIDDYAHHPTEIKTTLSSAKGRGRRTVALFQPHRYSRVQKMQALFSKSFSQADVVVVTEIFSAGETSNGVDGAAIARAIREQGHPAVFFEPDEKRLIHKTISILQPGDTIVTMGAGDIYKTAEKLTEYLRMIDHLKSKLSADAKLLMNEPLSRHTTLRVGGPAEIWAEPATEADLALLLQFAKEQALPVVWIGKGTNLLVRDGGIKGLCIHLAHPNFCDIRFEGHLIFAGCGVKLRNIVYEAKKHGLGGLSFMEGIPGSLGGALRMNAGAMGGSTMDVVKRIRFMDMEGNIGEIDRQELEVCYRKVPFFENHIALSAQLVAKPMDSDAIARELKEFSMKRVESQPAGSSAGCIFKNPNSIPAGKLIDELGLKNKAVGKARVSEEHGNFIINEGGATAKDILDLISLIQREAFEKRGIVLETEVVILGEEQ